MGPRPILFLNPAPTITCCPLQSPRTKDLLDCGQEPQSKPLSLCHLPQLLYCSNRKPTNTAISDVPGGCFLLPRGLYPVPVSAWSLRTALLLTRCHGCRCGSLASVLLDTWHTVSSEDQCLKSPDVRPMLFKLVKNFGSVSLETCSFLFL